MARRNASLVMMLRLMPLTLGTAAQLVVGFASFARATELERHLADLSFTVFAIGIFARFFALLVGRSQTEPHPASNLVGVALQLLSIPLALWFFLLWVRSAG
jgi:hypothetical protein